MDNQSHVLLTNFRILYFTQDREKFYTQPLKDGFDNSQAAPGCPFRCPTRLLHTPQLTSYDDDEFKLSTRIRQVIYKFPVIFLLGDSSTQGIFANKK